MVDSPMAVVDLTQQFKRAMRRMAATVTIITTADEGGRSYGMTATAVNSLSMDPPTLLICVNYSASIHAPLVARGGFCVNVLSIEHADLVGAFSGRLSGQDRFSLGDWQIDESSGLPYLEGAQCNFFCETSKVISEATHSIIIGRVVSTSVEETVMPLLYADGSLAAVKEFASRT